MSDAWQWLALIGLGAFHGVNPAMGWLFAVAFGLQEGRRGAVVKALPPIALGHALSVLVVVISFTMVQLVTAPDLLKPATVAVLIGFGGYRLVRGHRHRVRVGMRTGFAGLTLWSFLMASAHGAGLMILPLLLGMLAPAQLMALSLCGPGAEMTGTIAALGSAAAGLAVVLVHMAAMLVVIAIVGLVVFETVGLGILRRGWVNFDLVWAGALIGTGIGLLFLR
ncbi:hypothetical protein Sp245p_22735 (plasmid) [Azospirillum baldaniorum]|uniref:Uncharacterized protein n=1 Tax=Azospirillum baldaniorum TaxID=1064539 RepID=A0A9P1JZR7_9PROT|nr:hypothetical protein [Azospirillum baldaniorum]AWJ92672.1 hypothetical protein Sp245p_22735 [Azospirillum baldaniorum]TWA63529.1 hypothetical protein FBZ84_11052 [Azospirillum baldaniorum]TWA78080.1 hypothetical protein FBZ85_106240 [Azospirillum brasilense]CCD02815.1 conserved membrane protein of unknown function [Azospirillum baldaniorum]